MPSHASSRRTARQWLRDDLQKAVGVRGSYRLIRQDPRLLWLLLGYLVVAYGVLAVVLLLFGRLGSFGIWAVFPAIIAGGMFGGRLYRRREALNRGREEI